MLIYLTVSCCTMHKIFSFPWLCRHKYLNLFHKQADLSIERESPAHFIGKFSPNFSYLRCFGFIPIIICKHAVTVPFLQNCSSGHVVVQITTIILFFVLLVYIKHQTNVQVLINLQCLLLGWNPFIVAFIMPQETHLFIVSNKILNCLIPLSHIHSFALRYVHVILN